MENNQKSSYTLLYAEDDAIIRKAYATYFKTIFTTVYEACDGQDAYQLYMQYKPTILLFDINMPHLNGLDLVEKIRAIDTDVKIILLTAHLDTDKLLKAIPLGLVSYLHKPIKKRELKDVLTKLIAEIESENTNILKLSDNMYWDIKESILHNAQEHVHLTKSEIILMDLLASRSKTQYSLDDILEDLWQHKTQKDVTENSIRNIIKRLKQKLPNNAIENQYALGYKLCTIK